MEIYRVFGSFHTFIPQLTLFDGGFNSFFRVKDHSEKEAPFSRVTKFIDEWYTIETLRLLHGEQFLRKLLLENNLAAPELVEVDSYLGNSFGTITPEVRARYIR